jgi:hypothetical protein
MSAIGNQELLARLELDFQHESEHLKKTYTEGPMADLLDSVATIFDVAMQTSNQSCADPEDDSLWSDTVLDKFVTACTALVELAATIEE